MANALVLKPGQEHEPTHEKSRIKLRTIGSHCASLHLSGNSVDTREMHSEGVACPIGLLFTVILT